jgi:hypothetical protein
MEKEQAKWKQADDHNYMCRDNVPKAGTSLNQKASHVVQEKLEVILTKRFHLKYSKRFGS